jgi:hypothetical protein
MIVNEKARSQPNFQDTKSEVQPENRRFPACNGILEIMVVSAFGVYL